ncbi:MAG: hypothetical protein IKF38_05725 [Clostridia bacterium]|nr:hypothetical protein [Clostridia bacterium]
MEQLDEFFLQIKQDEKERTQAYEEDKLKAGEKDTPVVYQEADGIMIYTQGKELVTKAIYQADSYHLREKINQIIYEIYRQKFCHHLLNRYFCKNVAAILLLFIYYYSKIRTWR